jgi:hypothetical protein
MEGYYLTGQSPQRAVVPVEEEEEEEVSVLHHHHLSGFSCVMKKLLQPYRQLCTAHQTCEQSQCMM